MFLKKLEINGFKSFATKTTLDFSGDFANGKKVFYCKDYKKDDSRKHIFIWEAIQFGFWLIVWTFEPFFKIMEQHMHLLNPDGHRVFNMFKIVQSRYEKLRNAYDPDSIEPGITKQTYANVVRDAEELVYRTINVFCSRDFPAETVELMNLFMQNAANTF